MALLDRKGFQADHGVGPRANRCYRIPYSIRGPTPPLMGGADGRESQPIVPGRFGRSLSTGAQALPAQCPNPDRVMAWKLGAGKISVAADHEQLVESWRLIAIGWVTAQEARVCVPPDRLARQPLITRMDVARAPKDIVALELNLLVPVDRLPESLFEGHSGLKSEFPFRSGGIELSARLPVGPCRIPYHPSVESRQSGDQRHQILDADLRAGAQVDRIRLPIPLQGEYHPFSRIVDIKKFAGWGAISPYDDLFTSILDGVITLFDERRDHVRPTGIDVVAWAIEVRREQENRVEAVLGPIGLGLDQQHLLGQPIWRVGLFGIAVPEIVLLEGSGGEFGVGTDRSDCDEFLDPTETGVLHQEGAHEQIVVEEPPRVFLIGADSSHNRGEMNDGVGASIAV